MEIAPLKTNCDYRRTLMEIEGLMTACRYSTRRSSSGWPGVIDRGRIADTPSHFLLRERCGMTGGIGISLVNEHGKRRSC